MCTMPSLARQGESVQAMSPVYGTDFFFLTYFFSSSSDSYSHCGFDREVNNQKCSQATPAYDNIPLHKVSLQEVR